MGDTAREREEGETWRELGMHVHTIKQLSKLASCVTDVAERWGMITRLICLVQLNEAYIIETII